MASKADPSSAASVHPAEAGSVRRRVVRCSDERIEHTDDWIASEVPVALNYNDRPHVVMLATPADLEEFALGFSLSEAIIGAAGELQSLCIEARLEGIEIAMRIPPARAEAVAERQRHLTGSSSCGLCGAQQLEDVVRHPPPVAAAAPVASAALHRALSALQAAQPLNSRTGATHAAAWASPDGDLLLVREDVGRHNALDKLIGAMARSGIDTREGLLILTSRASYEMVQKAATVGIGLIAAISAPTALAIHLAGSTGVCLIGFARENGHVVYTHGQRIGLREG